MIDDFEEIFAFSFLITVNNDAHGFRFRIARAAANQRVFATFDIARGKRRLLPRAMSKVANTR